jgi:hypothetical protein
MIIPPAVIVKLSTSLLTSLSRPCQFGDRMQDVCEEGSVMAASAIGNATISALGQKRAKVTFGQFFR